MKAKRIRPITGATRAGISISGVLFIAGGLLLPAVSIIMAEGGIGPLLIGFGASTFFLVSGAWLIWRGKVRENQWDEYDKGHTEIKARVLKRYQKAHYRDQGTTHTYHLTVQFDTDMDQYELDAEVKEYLFKSVQEDGSMLVRYTDSDPTIAMLEGEWTEESSTPDYWP